MYLDWPAGVVGVDGMTSVAGGTTRVAVGNTVGVTVVVGVADGRAEVGELSGEGVAVGLVVGDSDGIGETVGVCDGNGDGDGSLVAVRDRVGVTAASAEGLITRTAVGAHVGAMVVVLVGDPNAIDTAAGS